MHVFPNLVTYIDISTVPVSETDQILKINIIEISYIIRIYTISC